jgi:hypothetical protein
MNIEQIPSDCLNRGIVVSIMERERPFVETFTDGESLAPFIFMKGLPIPYGAFVLFMAMRFAPQRSKGQMPKFYDPVAGFQFAGDAAVKALWDRTEIPTEMREKIAKSQKPGTVIHDMVAELYGRLTNSDAEEAKRSFRELIYRIEDDYQSSLIDPVVVTLSAA